MESAGYLRNRHRALLLGIDENSPACFSSFPGKHPRHFYSRQSNRHQWLVQIEKGAKGSHVRSSPIWRGGTLRLNFDGRLHCASAPHIYG